MISGCICARMRDFIPHGLGLGRENPGKSKRLVPLEEVGMAVISNYLCEREGSDS